MKTLIKLSLVALAGYLAYRWVKKNLDFSDLTIDWDV